MRFFVACLGLFFSIVASATVSPRIINGTGFDVSSPVAFERSQAEFALNWDFAVSYGHYYEQGNSVFFASQCGASYLGKGWFLTAAHCIDATEFGNDAVAVGSFDTAERSLFGIEKVRVHPLYDIGSVAFDLALLRVRDGLVDELNSYVSPVSLPFVNKAPSTDFRLGGWGATSPSRSNPQPANVMQRARLALQSNKECADIYGATFDPALMLCVFGDQVPAQDSCSGDSGGGLIAYEMHEAGKLGRMVEGVVSYGAVCGAAPSVYARADDFWLNEVYEFGVAPVAKVGLDITAYLPTTIDPSTDLGTITIRNLSGTAISLTDVQGMGGFVVTSTCSNVPAYGSCDVQVSNQTSASLRGGLLFYVAGERFFYPLYQRVYQSLAPQDPNFFIYNDTSWQYNSVTASLSTAGGSDRVAFDVKNEGFDESGVGFLEFDLNLNIADGFDTLSIDADGLGGRLALTGECRESLAFKVSPGDTITLFYTNASGRVGNSVSLANLTVRPSTTYTNALRSRCAEKQNFGTSSSGSGGTSPNSQAGSSNVFFLAGLLLLLGISSRKNMVCTNKRFF